MLNSGMNRIVTAIKPRICAIMAVAIIALAASASALAQTNSRVASGISMFIDSGQQQTIWPLISESSQDELLTYDFMADRVQFSAGVLATEEYNNPLFCFDM